jgi:hypothetical protein
MSCPFRVASVSRGCAENSGDMSLTDRELQLARARAAWAEPDDAVLADGWKPHSLPPAADIAAWFKQAERMVDGEVKPVLDDHDPVVLVAKAPHAGSRRSQIDLVARCLAFGAEVRSVRTFDRSDASAIAHALYPDVWTNYTNPPVGHLVWSRLAESFDRPEFSKIFGVPFDPAMVKEGARVVAENSLSLADFAEIWGTGRLPLARATAEKHYGTQATELMFGSRNELSWYRCDLPVGVQKLASSVLAFALRHPALYGGQPTIVLNGQFALLSRLFDYSDHGAVVFDAALSPKCTIADFRRLLVGRSDVPKSCRPGSIRRDAGDGFFMSDDPTQPVTPWSNVIHASDGYLSGAIESSKLVRTERNGRLAAELARHGYTEYELSTLVLQDPLVSSAAWEARLSRLTVAQPLSECVATITQYVPPLEHPGRDSGDTVLAALLEMASSRDPQAWLERPHPAPGARTAVGVVDRLAVDDDTARLGAAALAAGVVGLAVPLAGAGGRFGGYDVPEGSPQRMKAFAPVFKVGERRLSALDVRAEHLRRLRDCMGRRPPLFLSCSSVTWPAVNEWAKQNGDLAPGLGLVPEIYRIWAKTGGYPSEWDVLSKVVRDSAGLPLTKPAGSLGLLLSLVRSGVLDTWLEAGIRHVVAANSDDVGFRLDPTALGALEADDTLDAVVMVVPVANLRGRLPSKGGLLRVRTHSGQDSHYVEENALPDASVHEFLSTNQIYLRASSLRVALGKLERRPDLLPYYFEEKQLLVDDTQRQVWHAYRPYCDILRLMDRVEAIEISATPRDGQVGTFSPLKTQQDIAAGQAVIDSLGDLSP